MKTKVIAILNILIAAASYPLFFMALVYGMHAPDESPTTFEQVLFVGPVMMFAFSIWISGFIFSKHKVLASISSAVNLGVIGAMIWVVLYSG